PRETEKDFNDRLEQLEKLVDQLEKRVQTQRDTFEVQSANLRPFQKAQKALLLGLVEQALQVLLDSDAIEFGKAGARLQLELLLLMGRVAEVRLFLETIPQGELDYSDTAPGQVMPAYEWLKFLLAAAVGDYTDADAQLVAMSKTKDPTDAI